VLGGVAFLQLDLFPDFINALVDVKIGIQFDIHGRFLGVRAVYSVDVGEQFVILVNAPLVLDVSRGLQKLSVVNHDELAAFLKFNNFVNVDYVAPLLPADSVGLNKDLRS